MPLRTADPSPISEECARSTELADDVVVCGTEKVLTRNGSGCVALTDARRPGDCHALERWHSKLMLAQAALDGMEDVAAGRVLDERRLEGALSRRPAMRGNSA